MVSTTRIGGPGGGGPRPAFAEAFAEALSATPDAEEPSGRLPGGGPDEYHPTTPPEGSPAADEYHPTPPADQREGSPGAGSPEGSPGAGSPGAGSPGALALVCGSDVPKHAPSFSGLRSLSLHRTAEFDWRAAFAGMPCLATLRVSGAARRAHEPRRWAGDSWHGDLVASGAARRLTSLHLSDVLVDSLQGLTDLRSLSLQGAGCVRHEAVMAFLPHRARSPALREFRLSCSGLPAKRDSGMLGRMSTSVANVDAVRARFPGVVVLPAPDNHPDMLVASSEPEQEYVPAAGPGPEQEYAAAAATGPGPEQEYAPSAGPGPVMDAAALMDLSAAIGQVVSAGPPVGPAAEPPGAAAGACGAEQQGLLVDSLQWQVHHLTGQLAEAERLYRRRLGDLERAFDREARDRSDREERYRTERELRERAERKLRERAERELKEARSLLVESSIRRAKTARRPSASPASPGSRGTPASASAGGLSAGEGLIAKRRPVARLRKR